MFTREDLIHALMVFRIRFARGQMWLYLGKDIIMLVVGMYVINEMLLKAGITLPQQLLLPISALAGFGYLVAGYAVGYLDEKKGTWKLESHYSTEELNPYMKKMMEKLEAIDERAQRQGAQQ
jgi:hypothetical protein